MYRRWHMKKIKQLIQQLEEIQTGRGLERFFSILCNANAYKWSGLIVYAPQTACSKRVNSVGHIPRNILDSLSEYKVEGGLNNSEKPISFVSRAQLDEAHIEKDLLGVLLVKFNTKSSEFGVLVLGIVETVKGSLNELTERLGWFWSIITPYLYKAYQRNFKEEELNLTKRELECIGWASEGKTSWEISQILDISERTVNFHIANCIVKTDSINRQQAIAKCLLKGHFLRA